MCNTCKKSNCNCGSNNHSNKRILATIADIRATIAILNAKINEALGEINYPTLQKVIDRGNTTDNYITFKNILSELNLEDLNKIYNSLTIVQENEVAKILFNTYIDKLLPTSIELSKEGINLNVEDILSLAVTKDHAKFSSTVSGLDAVVEQDFITLKQSTITKTQLNNRIDTAISQAQGTPIPIIGTVLPQGNSIPSYITNAASADLYGGVGGTIYTQIGGNPITVSEGKFRKAYYDRATNLWTPSAQEFSLPIQDISGKVDKSSIESESLNLFNKELSISGGYYNPATGVITPNAASTRSSILIPIDRSKSPDGKLHILRNGSTNFANLGAFYSSNSTSSFISGIVGVTGERRLTLDIPLNATHVGVNISTNISTAEDDLAKFMVSYRNLPYLPYSPILVSIDGVTIPSPEEKIDFYPFVDYMGKKYDSNVTNSILEISLYNQEPRTDLYIKQFGRYFESQPPNKRWFLEIWDDNGIVYGGKNPTGRWIRNDDFKGIEIINIFNQNGDIVGKARIDWSTAWPTETGGFWNDGNSTNALLSPNIFTTNEKVESLHPQNGLKLGGLGDSIMAATNSFLVRASIAMGTTLVGNYGIGGSTIAQNINQPTVRNPMSVRYSEMSDDLDIIFVAGSTNDCNYSWTPFGEFTDRTVNTFYGALHVLCLGLKKKYIGKLIIFATAIKRNQDLPTPESVNLYGKTQKDYADAIKEVCAYYGIPVLDNFSQSAINPFIEEYRTPLIPDGTHPSPDGHQIMADAVVGFLRAFK